MRRKLKKDNERDHSPIPNQHFAKELQDLQQKNWMPELEMWGFPPDPERVKRAQYLLKQLIIGAIEAFQLKQRQKRIPKNFIFPSIILSDDPDMDGTAEAHASRGQLLDLIKIHVSQLRVLTQYKTDHIVRFSVGKTGEEIWKGSIAQLFRDIGREEMDHVIDDQNYLRKPNEVGHSSAAEYDAQEPEYKSLGTRLRLIMDEGAPSETINVLMNRLQRAIKHRQANRKKK